VRSSGDAVKTVLLIEGDADDARLIREMLAESGGDQFKVEHVDRLAAGQERLAAGKVDVILVDLTLPDSLGLDTLTKIRAQATAIPIVVLTGLDDEAVGMEAVQRGAQDYLIKGQADGRLLVRAIRYALERQRMQRDLLRQTRQLEARERVSRRIIEKNADGILILDEGCTVLFVNPAAEALFGCSAEEFRGQTVECPLSVTETQEIEIECPERGAVVAEMRIVPIEWEGRSAYLASLRDISERRRLEEETHRNARVRAALNSLRQLTLGDVDIDALPQLALQTVLSVPWLKGSSHGCMLLVEDDPECLVLKATKEVPETVRKSCARAPFGKCLCGLAAANLRVQSVACVTQDCGIACEESMPHVHYCAPILSGGKCQGVLSVCVHGQRQPDPWYEDFFAAAAAALVAPLARARAEQERTGLAVQLRRSEKMATIGKLAGGLAHEFNNLLTGLSASVQFTLEALPDWDNRIKEDLVEAQHLVSQAEELTRHLLAFSRNRPVKPVVVDLNDLVEGLSGALDKLIGESVELVFCPGRGVGCVRADSAQLEQVLLNLAVSARDAMPEGGRLTIETAAAELDEAFAQSHEGCGPGHYVMLAVSDTGAGAGAREVVRQHVTESSFLAQESGRGVGVGLALVAGIVKQQHGHLWVYSEPEQGATFKIYLPSVSGHAPKPAGDDKPSPGRLLGTETILVVEDTETVRTVVERILKARGYTVFTVAGADEADEVFSQHGADIALLLADVVMPKRNGPELYEELARKQPGLKVLYMSGYTDATVSSGGLLDPGAPFIAKPFTVDALSCRIREVLDKPDGEPDSQR